MWWMRALQITACRLCLPYYRNDLIAARKVSLDDGLDTKRSSFPRVFFLSDDELLSVLGNSDPTSIPGHLLELLDKVKEMQWGRNNQVVEGMNE
mmetsp:Transcript_14368/g.21491  ORF Transcript_14368/g.21491 Transcript_14368/m.21491 type:complete len:94 (-) Transcript_14368:207-488(-)